MQTLTAGDFNGDGNPDLAIASRSNNTVSILLGVGDGTFTAGTSLPTGTQPYSVASADLNGDGKLDLAVTNFNDSTVSVLLGTGNGTFQTQVPYATGSDPDSVTSADFNGDGILDLAVANLNDSTVSVLLGNGNGTFQTQVPYPTGSGPFSVTTGDFNGDGILDLATANYNDNKASVLLGNGDGSFQPKTDYPTGTNPIWLGAANLHSRGTFDLAVADGGANTVSVLLNNAPSPLPYTKTSVMYYTLTGSDGATWMPMDTIILQQRIVPACTCKAVLTANSSLWTNTTSLNQDIGIEVSGGKYGYYPGTLVAWQESGSGANLFSPNAATVRTTVNLQSGVAYTVRLVWKSNVATTTGQIWASAGKAGGARSPTTLQVEMPGFS